MVIVVSLSRDTHKKNQKDEERRERGKVQEKKRGSKNGTGGSHFAWRLFTGGTSQRLELKGPQRRDGDVAGGEFTREDRGGNQKENNRQKLQLSDSVDIRHGAERRSHRGAGQKKAILSVTL